MTELEALEAVAALGLLANHVQDAVDQLRALRIMSLSLRKLFFRSFRGVCVNIGIETSL